MSPESATATQQALECGPDALNLTNGVTYFAEFFDPRTNASLDVLFRAVITTLRDLTMFGAGEIQPAIDNLGAGVSRFDSIFQALAEFDLHEQRILPNGVPITGTTSLSSGDLTTNIDILTIASNIPAGEIPIDVQVPSDVPHYLSGTTMNVAELQHVGGCLYIKPIEPFTPANIRLLPHN